jgi:hypothetical protein
MTTANKQTLINRYTDLVMNNVAMTKEQSIEAANIWKELEKMGAVVDAFGTKAKAPKQVVQVKVKHHEIVYKIKGDIGIGAWIPTKNIEQDGVAIAFDIQIELLERLGCTAALDTTRRTLKALGL